MLFKREKLETVRRGGFGLDSRGFASKRAHPTVFDNRVANPRRCGTPKTEFSCFEAFIVYNITYSKCSIDIYTAYCSEG